MRLTVATRPYPPPHSAEYFKTVHLTGDGYEDHLRELRRLSKEEWTKKLQVDDPGVLGQPTYGGGGGHSVHM